MSKTKKQKRNKSYAKNGPTQYRHPAYGTGTVVRKGYENLPQNLMALSFPNQGTAIVPFSDLYPA